MKFVWFRGDLVVDLEKVRNFSIMLDGQKVTLLGWFNDKESIFINYFGNLKEAKKYLSKILGIEEE